MTLDLLKCNLTASLNVNAWKYYLSLKCLALFQPIIVFKIKVALFCINTTEKGC